jgi:hypothetical protein
MSNERYLNALFDGFLQALPREDLVRRHPKIAEEIEDLDYQIAKCVLLRRTARWAIANMDV